MSQTLVDIFNMALGACGSSSTISDASERSREAAVCRLWYPLVRDNVQTAAPWPSVKAHQRLARLSASDVPWTDTGAEPGYDFAYSCPSDMLIPYHLDSFQRFSYGVFGTTRVLSTSDEGPILTYNRRSEDVAMWDHPLIISTVYTLATHIARQVTGRSTTIGENKQLATEIVQDMRMSVANAQDERFETLPAHLVARGYANPTPSRYYYPMQSLNFGAAT